MQTAESCSHNNSKSKPPQSIYGDLSDEEHTSQKHVLVGETHIYHTDQYIEEKWKDILREASLNLTSALTQHYTMVIRREQETLERIKTEITEYLKLTQGAVREQHIAKWKEQSRIAEEEARKLAQRKQGNKTFSKS